MSNQINQSINQKNIQIDTAGQLHVQGVIFWSNPFVNQILGFEMITLSYFLRKYSDIKGRDEKMKKNNKKRV